jgi:hypothetical protein
MPRHDFPDLAIERVPGVFDARGQRNRALLCDIHRKISIAGAFAQLDAMQYRYL